MIKQVLIVRKDLHMRTGKTGAQCAHAAMKVFFDKKSIRTRSNQDGERIGYELTIPLTDEMFDWVTGIFTKICVYVNSEAELLALQQQAIKAGIVNALVEDNGLTEFHGQKTVTVLAIGPDESEKIDLITGRLPLL